jgi:lysozyme
VLHAEHSSFTRDIPHAAPKPRRWKWFAGLVAVVAIAASLWTWWLPQHRPSLGAGERFGIDVSNHQGDIDWDRVARDDIHFAYIKATEGADWVDQRFATNWASAADAGVDRGAYHFFTLCRSGDEQAANFLRTVRPDGELPPALDLELAGNCSRRPGEDSVTAEVGAFIEAVEAATGDEIVLYIGDDFEARYPIRNRLDRPLWHRRWYRRPNVEPWVVWQFTGMAHVERISGDVDLNVMRSSLSRVAEGRSAA